jgi:hypothetical protein
VYILIKLLIQIHNGFNFILKVGFHLQWILWSYKSIGQHDVVGCDVMKNQ